MKRRVPNRQAGARPANAGFTLIDLVAAAFAIGVLSAVGVYYVNVARIKASSSGCRNNLRQIGVALAQYTDVHHMLPAVTLAGPGFQVGQSPFAQLLPHLALGKNIPYESRRAWFEQAAGLALRPYRFSAVPLRRTAIRSTRSRRGSRNVPWGACSGRPTTLSARGTTIRGAWRGTSALPPEHRGAFEIGTRSAIATSPTGWPKRS